MRVAQLGAMDIQTAVAFLLIAAISYSAWLTSIVFCAANDRWSLLVAAASFFPVGIMHGVGIWFGGWRHQTAAERLRKRWERTPVRTEVND
jgi:hypothetical protein